MKPAADKKEKKPKPKQSWICSDGMPRVAKEKKEGIRYTTGAYRELCMSSASMNRGLVELGGK